MKPLRLNATRSIFRSSAAAAMASPTFLAAARSPAHSSYILISDHADLGNHPTAVVRARSQAPDDVRLIDMNGNVVHTWTVDPYFNKRCRLLPNGNLLCAESDKTITEYDWDSNVVW